jgi:hypothetical protein
MKDGTIILFTADPHSGAWKDKMYAKILKWATGSYYSHALIYFEGYCYSALADGISKDRYIPGGAYFEFYREFTEEEKNSIREYLESSIGLPYNYPKLVTMLFIRWTRWIWDLLRWCPFDFYKWGEICSVVPDEAYKHAGIDLLPGRHEGSTFPGAFIESKLLKKVS